MPLAGIDTSTPHGMHTMHADELNADLLVFIRG